MSVPPTARNRSGSRLSHAPHYGQASPSGDLNENDGARDIEGSTHGTLRPRAESALSRLSFSTSMNQKTPARSYFHRSFHEQRTPADTIQDSLEGVREDTAELASWALSDVASIRSGHSPARHQMSSASSNQRPSQSDTNLGERTEQDDFDRHGSTDSSRPGAIEEVSEPTSPDSFDSSRISHGTSALTEMVRNSCPTEEGSTETREDDMLGKSGVQPVIVREGIISQPDEQTTLLLRKAAHNNQYGSVQDLEGQSAVSKGRISQIRRRLRCSGEHGGFLIRTMTNPKSWNRKAILEHGLRQPASYVPPVMLGLLLNILDALSYGMILFPLGQPIFASLGPDGISMFYVSCIVSQLVYSCGGSIFKGGIGSEMIEVVPFFHKMAFTILVRVGEENPHAVLATTIVSYSLSSILTGAVFYLMGRCKLGALIGFFPSHILMGCIGGVGWFLVATGLEVSARLEGNLEYNLITLRKLFEVDTLFLWTIPLVLAIVLLFVKRWLKHSLTDATYFLSIIAIFYFFVAAIPDLQLPELRAKGWVFDAPEAGIPFYHFYSLYDFRAVDWKALGATIPAMLALTFFGVLHVPINVPALGLSLGEDNVDIDRELRAHGWSNVLSGLCGSIQNYLVYTNTVLFVGSGGNSRVAGIMLAVATFGILIVGPVIIGYIPIMVVSALIFYLGFSLMKEGLLDPWRKVHRLEYLTIVIIVVTMGAWDFVIGILVGILLACISFVLQTSQISAIRGSLPGNVANSTVRRHPVHYRFLQEAGQQIHVMKLAGYLFFGTMVGVEKQIRALLLDKSQTLPIRFLVLDLYNVDGVDYSATEAFTRIKRLLSEDHVHLIICGITMDGNIGRSLQIAGLFDAVNGKTYFETLNSALEDCENKLLKTFYQQRDVLSKPESTPTLDIPIENPPTFSSEMMFSSPRRHHLHRVATTTLTEQESMPLSKWQGYKQPLQLILQTFITVSDESEEFWSRTVPFFIRKTYEAETILYNRGDPPDGFYLLESGILKAEYVLPQGKFTELIVAGTTCGELPFFSGTQRTSTTSADRDCVVWMLNEEKWQDLQKNQPDIAQELLKISLKLTSERMDAITKYMLLMSG